MPLFVTVSTGRTPTTARPVLAVGDQALIRRMLALVPDALGASAATKVKRPATLTLLRQESDGDGGA